MLLPEGEPGVVGGADDVEGPALALSASDKGIRQTDWRRTDKVEQ